MNDEYISIAEHRKIVQDWHAIANDRVKSAWWGGMFLAAVIVGPFVYALTR